MTSNLIIPRRALGQTGETLPVIGFGGIIVVGAEQSEANNYVAEAFDHGVNYFDVAPSYGRGEAEEKLGPALQPYRSRSFLACKTTERDAANARREMEQSLRRLRTDHFDLYQLHSLTHVEEDVERALAPDGALQVVLDAREKGMVRYIGFSAHSVAAALRAMETGLFDTILYPINFTCHFEGNFDQAPLEEARRRGMGILALKAMARTKWPAELKKEDRPFKKTWYEPVADPEIAGLALRWTLSQGVTAAIPPGMIDLWRIALNAPRKEEPLNEEELQRLRATAQELEPIFAAP